MSIIGNEENEELNSEKEEEINEINQKNEENEIKIVLQLGDVIRIRDPTSEKLNDNTFFIDYLDSSKMKLINVESLDVTILAIDEEGIIGNGTITSIIIISRSDSPSYARQNGLVPGKWINIFMDSDPPAIFTGEITNLEEDMIEIKTYPDKFVIYINFDYKGFPEDLPIQDIQIREKPSKLSETMEEPNINEGEFGEEEQGEIGEQGLKEGEIAEKDLLEENEENEVIPELHGNLEMETVKQPVAVPVASVKNQLREIILKGNQIKFSNEYIGPVVQLVNVESKAQRYSLENQTSDLLDELLSTVPNSQRTSKVLNNIHTMIERFVQLRQEFSFFDEYGTVDGIIVNEASIKPLAKFLMKFNKNLYWVLPVVKNLKKIYKGQKSSINEENLGDVIILDMDEDLNKMEDVINAYKSNNINDDQNKYANLYKDLNPYFTPFEYVEEENNTDIMYNLNVGDNINVIINNLTNFYSSILKNNAIKNRKFVIEKYNLGLNRLEATNIKGSSMTTKTVKLTNPDILSINSIITLPEPAIRFSRINLNNTNILERANLNKSFLNYWQLFKKSTYVNKIEVDSLDQQIEFNENNFANSIKNFSLNIPKEELQGFTKKNIYKQFANLIVPKIKVIFNLMKKYINGKLSIIEIVNYLEPFLIYSDNLTYMQYVSIVRFINEKISEFNRTFVERSRIFLNLKRTKNSNVFYNNAYSIINMVDQKDNRREEVFETYGFFDIKHEVYSNSEILQMLTLKDCGKLYASALSLQSVPLMFPSEFSAILDNEKIQIDKQIQNDTSSDSCKNILIAKMYTSEPELKGDNDREIYFDKKYDDTDYGFLDNFEKEMIEKSPEDFITFLINKIKEKKKLNDEEAEYLADTLISGYKKVLNGQYAILYDQMNVKNEYSYYIRKNSQWVFDPNVDPKIITDNQNILCNLQDKCISVPGKVDDKCESMPLNELELQQTLLKNVMNEFDVKYNISKQEFEKKSMELFEYNLNILPVLTQIKNYNMIKYNNYKYDLGKNIETDGQYVISPYAKLKNLIVGQQDFVKKNYDIIKFAGLFCRKPILNGIGPLGEMESEHWLYCLKTNVKLMPMFIYEMSSAFITNINEPQKYNEFVELLIHKIGATLNADGDAWVDVHSGEEIKKIAFNEEEGYEEGFKVSTRGVLEKDISLDTNTNMNLRNVSEQTKKKYDSPETITINNIINAISVSMGINIETQKEFIMSCVIEKMRETLPKESDYLKQIKEMANKGKNIPSYKDLYSTVILYYTLGMILISIQTITPSIKTRKTFPGCVRSFDGYPFEGAGDLSSLKYLACIAYKIRSSDAPWNVLNKKKETFIETKIKEAIDGTERIEGLLSMPIVKRKIEEKTEYLILSPEEAIPEEHSILSWTQFLPPLVPIKLKQLLDISSEFKTKLQLDLKVGSREQREKILIIESKIIFFSLAIQEKIQNIIHKKQLFLRKSSGEPYLENSCCNEKDNITTLQYFEKEDSSITEYNNIVKRLTSIIDDIQFYSKALILYSDTNTKNIYPPISKEYDEETIFTAFIKFCNFRSLKPIDPELSEFCTDKPDTITENDTLIEIIRKLKEDRREYSEAQFLKLIQTLSRRNILDVIIDKKVASSFSILSAKIDSIDNENDELIGQSLIRSIKNCLDTYDIASEEITNETKALNDKVIIDNRNIKRKIIDFITMNKSRDVSSKTIKHMKSFIENINEWNSEKSHHNENNKISNDSNYNIINFFKTFIQNIVKTFPNMILNKVNYSDYNNIIPPNYWKLSASHKRKIMSSIYKYYKPLHSFHGVNQMTNILQEVQLSSKNVLLLANNTPSFTTIKINEKEFKPIFDERTSKLLFEHYLLLVFLDYINLSDMDEMIVTEVKKPMEVADIFSVDYLEDNERKTEFETFGQRTEMETTLLKGNKKDLRQKVADLLIAFIEIMEHQKDIIDISYEQIQDRAFKIREKEKDIITDRLKGLSEEEREADTIMKINKLGAWNKGLQKGLTKYSAKDYENEQDFMLSMMKYENVISKKVDPNNKKFDIELDDYIEEVNREKEIEKEAYDIGNYRDDYMDGNFEGDDLDYGNFEDYDS